MRLNLTDTRGLPALEKLSSTGSPLHQQLGNPGARLLYAYMIKSRDSNHLHSSRHESWGLYPVGTGGLFVNNYASIYGNLQ